MARRRAVRKVHRCVSVQDGHSATEQLVYDLMWRTGRPLDPDTRVFQLPLEALAWKVKIAERNLRPLLQRLVQKKSILKTAEPDRGHKIPATYQVFSFRKILVLRKEAGLEYVVRSKGVEFIGREEALALEAERAAALERLFDLSESSPDVPSPVVSSLDEATEDLAKSSADIPSPQTAQSSPDVCSKTSPDVTSSSSLLGHLISGQLSAAAAFLPKGLGRQVRAIAGPNFTDAAVGRLWRECRRRAPDCSVAEVLHFTGAKMEAIRGLPDVGNPVGLLLTSVPAYFEGGTLAEYREQQAREAAEARRLNQENRRYYQQLLDDPQASAEDRAWAAAVLQTLPEELL